MVRRATSKLWESMKTSETSFNGPQIAEQPIRHQVSVSSLSLRKSDTDLIDYVIKESFTAHTSTDVLRVTAGSQNDSIIWN